MTYKKELIAMVRVAFGDKNITDPHTSKPFRVKQTAAGTTIESAGLLTVA